MSEDQITVELPAAWVRTVPGLGAFLQLRQKRGDWIAGENGTALARVTLSRYDMARLLEILNA